MSVWPYALSIALSQAPAPTPEELIKKIDSTPDLKAKSKPFEISASLARLYFGQGRVKEAQTYALEAIASAEPALTFTAQQQKKVGALAADFTAKCEPEAGAESNLAALLEIARKHAASNRAKEALFCARKATAPVADVMLMDAHARFLAKDMAGARAGYDRVIAAFPDQPEAHYARGALTLDLAPDDVKQLEAAKADLEKFLALAPTARQSRNAKALLERTKAGIDAGGLSKLAPAPIPEQPTSPPVLNQATIDAFQNAPRTPESEARFAKLIEDGEDALAKGQPQEALNAFRQVMPYQPDNPRLRAGMAWSLVKLGKPMADNVWRVATSSPEAIDQLGDRLKAKGDAEGAKALWNRLAESVPAYAPKLEGKR